MDVDKAVAFLASNGGNYLIKSKTLDNAYNVFSGLMRSGFDGLCLTTKQPGPLMEQYDIGNAWIMKLGLRDEKDLEVEKEETEIIGLLALGDGEGEDRKYIFSSNLDRIVETVEDFLTRGEDKVVLLDGLEYILVGEELLKYIYFIASLRVKLKERNSCLLLPIDPKTLSERELRLLERETMDLDRALQEQSEERDDKALVNLEP